MSPRQIERLVNVIHDLAFAIPVGYVLWMASNPDDWFGGFSVGATAYMVSRIYRGVVE